MHRFNSRKNIVVIGGNAAGAAAAASAKRKDPDSEVILIEKSEFISTGTCELPYLLSGEIDDYRKLVLFDGESFKKEKGAEVLNFCRVDKIDRQNKIISVASLKNNETKDIRYDKLILATGSKVNIPAGFDQPLKNLFTLKNVEDAIRLQSFFENSEKKEVVIIGSGFTGLELCEALKLRGFSVTLVEKGSLPLPWADLEIQKIIEKVLIENNIRFIGGVSKITPVIKDNSVTTLNLDGRLIDSPVVILNTGVIPSTILAEAAKIKLEKNMAICVNSRLQTNDPDIFAAGDCIGVTNFVTGGKEYLPLATLAYRQGKTAGENAAGGTAIYNPVVKNTALRFFNSAFIQTGLTEKEAIQQKINYISASAAVNNLVSIMPGKRKIFGKIIAEKFSGVVIGASFWGGKELSADGDLICLMIKNKMHFCSLREIEYNYSPPVSPMHNILSILAKKLGTD